MTNPIHPDALKVFDVGSEIKSSALNAFLRKSRETIQPTQGYVSADFAVQNERQFAFEEIIGKNEIGEDIPKYSIFTIESPGLDFNIFEPKTKFKKFEAGDKFLITNGTVVFPRSVDTRAILIGNHDYYLLKYDPADGVPNAGDTLGPKTDSFKVSVEGTGLVALSKGDTQLELVWCALHTQGILLEQRGKLVPGTQLEHNEVGPLRLWKQTGTTTGTIVHVERPGPIEIDVLNLTKTLMVAGTLMVVSYAEEYEMPIIFPDELEECFQPNLVPQLGFES